MSDGTVNVERVSEAKDHKSKHGLYRALINNMVIGVSEGGLKNWSWLSWISCFCSGTEA